MARRHAKQEQFRRKFHSKLTRRTGGRTSSVVGSPHSTLNHIRPANKRIVRARWLKSIRTSLASRMWRAGLVLPSGSKRKATKSA